MVSSSGELGRPLCARMGVVEAPPAFPAHLDPGASRGRPCPILAPFVYGDREEARRPYCPDCCFLIPGLGRCPTDRRVPPRWPLREGTLQPIFSRRVQLRQGSAHPPPQHRPATQASPAYIPHSSIPQVAPSNPIPGPLSGGHGGSVASAFDTQGNLQSRGPVQAPGCRRAPSLPRGCGLRC